MRLNSKDEPALCHKQEEKPVSKAHGSQEGIGSVFNIIFGWVSRNYEETPERMTEICCDLLSEKDWNIGSGIRWRKEQS